jgi:hypothetical protein
MRLLTTLLVLLSVLSSLRAQSLEKEEDTLSDNNSFKENYGYLFALPFYPNGSPEGDFDELPQFPGGIDSLRSFILENLQLPEVYRKSQLNGIVWIPVGIDKHGEPIFNASIAWEEEFTEEAHRLIQLMPYWEPAKQDGMDVYCTIIIPIYYGDLY